MATHVTARIFSFSSHFNKTWFGVTLSAKPAPNRSAILSTVFAIRSRAAVTAGSLDVRDGRIGVRPP